MQATTALILWGLLTLFFLFAEALTPQLLCIWFSVGSLVALICAALGVPFWVQPVVFLLVSGAMVLAMRPLSKKFKALSKEHLSANRILGRHATVVETIDPDQGLGQIRVDRAIWSAKSVDGSVMEKGIRVKVVKIEGVRAIVRLSRMQPNQEAAEETAETKKTDAVDAAAE